jgi:hypothetical protein
MSDLSASILEAFQDFKRSIRFDQITTREAKLLRRQAFRHERTIGQLFENDLATEAQFIEAMELQEALHVFALTGERP